MGGRPGMTVSVAIVTYNSAHTLGPLTASLQAQRGVDFEVLITDNASTDRTVELLEKLQPGACRRNLDCALCSFLAHVGCEGFNHFAFSFGG